MKKLKILLVILLLVIAGGVGLLIYIGFQNKNTDTFLRGTTLNGEDIEGKTPEEAAELLKSQYQNFSVEIIENGEVVLSGDQTEFGYAFDEEKLLAELQEEEQAQKESLLTVFRTLLTGKTISVETAFEFDETVFDEKVQAASLSVPRVASSEAQLVLNADGTAYEIQEAVQGNEIDDSIFQSMIKDEIDTAIAEGTIEETLTLYMPVEAYTSETVDTDTTELEAQMEEKNKELKLQNTFGNMSVTYQFGDETVVLDSATILSWISYDENDEFVVDEEQIAAYVSGLSSTYNTRGMSRTFTTTLGYTVSFTSDYNMYGYVIDPEEECAQLKSDILAAEPVTREPCYVETNSWGNPYYLRRNGTDDLAGTYVEVDLTAQHVWFYKNGELIIESDCVTGDVSNDTETITGVYPLAYKESPSVLTGGDAADGYETEVQYWMPFNEGQGLHDAYWRSSFGGSIYQTNGSHGCVNLPSSVAQTIFENIETGTAIIVYEEP